MWRFCRVIGVIAVALAASRSAASQQDNCLTTAVPIAALNPQGLALEGLRVEDLTAKLKGKPAKVVSVTRDSRPMRLFIFLDGSGSMRYRSEPWVLALRMAEAFVEAADPSQPVSLVVFGRTVIERIDSTGKSAEVKSALLRLSKERRPPAGQRMTGLFDTVYSELNRDRQTTLRDLVLLISDGVDTVSRLRAREFAVKMSEARTPVSSIIIDTVLEGSRGRTPEELAGPTDLDVVADKTGGMTARIMGGTYGSDLVTALNRIAVAMNRSHHMQLELTEPLARGGKLEVAFISQPPKKSERNVLVYPQLVRGCGGQP